MKLVFTSVSALIAAVAQANVYLHSPRGSNNRLNERSAQNTEPKRLFFSNNNRRGGYNVGDSTKDAFTDEAGQFAMSYFEDSILTVEWTNLVGCGADEDGDKIHNCEIVLQSMCQDDVDTIPADSFTLRNGKTTSQMPYTLNAAHAANPNGRCFRDSHNRDLPHMLNNRLPNIPDGQASSIEFCRSACRDLGFTYAGLHYTRECWCGNEFGRYGEAPLHECNHNCQDQSGGDKCGSSWRSNIYLTTDIDPNTAANETQTQKNTRRAASSNAEHGLHEPWEFYDRCDGSKHLGSTRYGMECLAERQTWPSETATPWVDVAVLSDNTAERCTHEVLHSNHHEFFECVEYYDAAKTKRKHWSLYDTQAECEANSGDWLGFYKVGEIMAGRDETECAELIAAATNAHYVWGRPMSWADLAADRLSELACIKLPERTQCLDAPATRSGYLGDVDNERHTPRYQWRLPKPEQDKRCIFRIRYVLSSNETEQLDHKNNVVHVRGDPLTLAIAPISAVDNQIVYEDRSHVFKILKRAPAGIDENLTIHNMVVRGKRGNIVQTFPAVEYDFVPNRLSIPQGDAIHVQWAGSNTHNNGHPAGDGQAGDAGEGQGGTDRHNMIQLLDRQANLVAPHENHTLFKQADWVWSSHEQGNLTVNSGYNLALSLATSGYYHCKNQGECVRSFEALGNTLNDQLNNAPASFAGEMFVPAQGEYNYKCMRNDNFSNRSQKGQIIVL